MSRALPLTARTLFQLRWQIVSYGLGLAAWAFLIVIIFPSVSEEFADVEFPDFYEALFGEQIRDISRPSTFITLEYMTWVPIVLGVYAVVGSTGLLAGEESRGSADFLFVQPLSRRRIYLEKALGWLIGAVAAVLLTGIGFALGLPFADLGGENGVSLASFIGGSLAALPVVSFYAALGLLLGAVAPTRGTASGVLTVLLIVGYVFSSFSQLAAATEWLRYLSPFYYGGITEVLSEGVSWGNEAGLLVATLVIGLTGLFAFERREIGVDHWQWRHLIGG
jgi:ABC-type transport system involved in multi-copper enzyme maturation permease subunit